MVAETRKDSTSWWLARSIGGTHLRYLVHHVHSQLDLLLFDFLLLGLLLKHGRQLSFKRLRLNCVEVLLVEWLEMGKVRAD